VSVDQLIGSLRKRRRVLNEKDRATQRAYRNSDSGKAARKRWRDSPEGNRAHRRGEQRRAEWRRAVHELVDSYKKRPCADCGGMFDPVCMDFDHRPGEIKTDSVSHLISRRAWGLIEAEIKKCDVVCANCHRIRTYRKRNHSAVCGGKRGIEPQASPQLQLLETGERK